MSENDPAAEMNSPVTQQEVEGSAYMQKSFYTAKTHGQGKVLLEEDNKEEKIKIRVFLTTPATISYRGGTTINLGNYESAQIAVMVSLPCYLEEITECFETAKKFVDDRLKFLAQEAKDWAKKRADS